VFFAAVLLFTGCHPVWRARHMQDAACQGSRQLHQRDDMQTVVCRCTLLLQYQTAVPYATVSHVCRVSFCMASQAQARRCQLHQRLFRSLVPPFPCPSLLCCFFTGCHPVR
jgi:hypothetical protein